MTVDLNRALLDLEEKGEKGYTKDIEKLDKFAEKMHKFASKDNPEIPLSKDNKDDINRLFSAHTQNARVRYFINNHDYKKPFLYALKLPTENKRDNFIYSVKEQMRDDFYDAKKLLSTNPELFTDKEKEELNKLFSSVDKQGGIGKYFEKNFGMEAPETEAKEMIEQVKNGKAKEGFEFQAKTSALRDSDAGKVYSFTVDVKEYAQKGQLHPKERKGINIDINSTPKQREAAIKNVAKNFKEDLQTTRDKLASGKLDYFLSPSEKEVLKEKLKEIDKFGGADKFIEKSFGKYAPDSVKTKENVKQQTKVNNKDLGTKGNQLFSDKDKQSMAERFDSKSKLANKAKEIANNKDVKPIFSRNSSPKLNAPSKSIDGR